MGGSYGYTSSKPQLETPTGISITGTVVSWDSVANATEYDVYIYEGSFSYYHSTYTITETSLNIDACLKEGTYSYAARVYACAQGYPKSEAGESEFVQITKTYPALSNVVMSEDGVLTWDAFDGASKYEYSLGSIGGFLNEPRMDLKYRLKTGQKASGTYDFYVYAIDEGRNQLSSKYTGTYTYVAEKEKLATPTNISIADKILTWDAVENAQEYSVYVCMDSFSGTPIESIYINENQCDVTKYLREGTNKYGFIVKATATGYPASDNGYSSLVEITYLLPSLNVTLNDGVLTWSEFTGANDYYLKYLSVDGEIVTERSVNVLENIIAADLRSGIYPIILYARDASGKQISTMWNYSFNYRENFTVDVLLKDAFGTVTGSGSYKDGESVTIKAIPIEGYEFSHWSYANNSAEGKDTGIKVEGAGAEYTFDINYECRKVFLAHFKKAHKHTPDKRTTGFVAATTTADGQYIIETYCTECKEVLSEEKKTISRIAQVSLNSTEYTYTAKVISPSITVKDATGRNLTAGTDYTVKEPDGRKKVGAYSYKIEFKGNYKGTVNLSFVINPKKASIKSFTVGKGKATLKMSSKASATGGSTYQVAYKVKGTKKWTYKTFTSQSKSITKLKKGKKYEIKVRAYKKIGSKTYYGEWSKTKTSKKIK